MNESTALSGLRVLDLTRVLAGPFCTMQLSDWGAEVLKIEEPGRGDETREWGPPWVGEAHQRLSAYFVCVNRNKRSITLNLKTEQGQALARRLALRSDILVENFKPGQLARWGLSYSDLQPSHPGLIYCSITGFGQTGPYRDRPGYDYVIQGMSGLMSITGPVEGSGWKVGVAISDVIAGLNAATAILAALHFRQQTGRGQQIDVSLLETQIAAMVNVASNYLVSGESPRRYGNQHANIVPYQTFRGRDGDFVVAVGNDLQFARFCKVLGRSELARNPRFGSNPGRVQNRAALEAILKEVLGAAPVDHWVESLLAEGIPAGRINDIPTILADPHVQDRGLVQEVSTSPDGKLRLIGSPVQFSGTPPRPPAPPPTLGQHTDQVLQEILGVNAQELTEFRHQGVI